MARNSLDTAHFSNPIRALSGIETEAMLSRASPTSAGAQPSAGAAAAAVVVLIGLQARVVDVVTLADERGRILRWLREVPPRIRDAAGAVPVELALKLMNAKFGDDFQLQMLRRAGLAGADAAVVFNRLFDSARGVAYGGWDLSDRNLRVLASGRDQTGGELPMTGTGNVCQGRVLLDYARLGCESVQLHTFFQLPLGEYPARAGSRTARALHALVFDPHHGIIAGMLEMENQGKLNRVKGELRFLDVVGTALP